MKRIKTFKYFENIFDELIPSAPTVKFDFTNIPTEVEQLVRLLHQNFTDRNVKVELRKTISNRNYGVTIACLRSNEAEIYVELLDTDNPKSYTDTEEFDGIDYEYDEDSNIYVYFTCIYGGDFNSDFDDGREDFEAKYTIPITANLDADLQIASQQLVELSLEE